MKITLPDPFQFALVLFLTSLALPAVAQTAALSACASHTPPFVMFAQGQPVGGFSYELLQKLAQHMGKALRVSLLPWARCLQDVKSGKVDLAIDAYDDAERRKSYWYSNPYHTLTPQIFFRTRTLINTLKITDAKQLQHFKGCGVRDYTYEHYDLDATQLDRGAGDDLHMLKKLQAGFCDYAIEELEYVIGGRSFVANWPNESDLNSMRPGWARGPQVHFLIGKEHPLGKVLLKDLDDAIAHSEKTGETAALRKKYFDPAIKTDKKP